MATPTPTTTTISNQTPIRPVAIDSDNSSLPAILCLHGGGSNSTVFKIQSRRLIWALGKQFRFVFAQAPIEGTPGHGMLPVFASCAPFYRWVTRRFVAGESDREVMPVDEADDLNRILDAVMRENGGVDKFVGVMGFSQGARLVAGLLLRQVMQGNEGAESGRIGRTKFKFGIMIGGPYPPIAMGPESEEQLSMESYALLKEIPTVHAWGRDDHVKEGCIQLADVCEGDICFRMDFEGGHHLPLKDNEARDLCDLIMAAWYAGGGEKTVGKDEKY